MVTALKDTDDRVRCLDAKADDFLAKPVNDITLISRVRSLVRLKRMFDQWRVRKETTKCWDSSHPGIRHGWTMAPRRTSS